jgi:type I restriction enzyme S subunit
MEVKPGYKQTEAGVIPEEWECAKLLNFLSFISYGFTNPMPTVQDGVFMVTAADINDGRIQLETARKTSESAYRTLLTAKSKPRPNDILLTKDGTLGRLALVGNEAICINQSVAVLRPNEKIDPRFLKLLLESPRYQKRMIEDAGGSTIKHIYITIVDKMPIGLPLNKAEQRSVAEALSDMDALLGGLDRLIAKKRNLKQAAMQQLLTGQTRLPGFDGEWETRRLGDVAHIKTGSRNNEDKVEDGEYPFFVRSEIIERINTYSHDCEAILVPGEGRIGDIFHYVNGRFDVHQRVYAITQFKPGMSAKFVYFYMAMRFGVWAMQNTVKATVDSLRLPTFQTFEMRVPPTKGEQVAIAAVLSDVDAELFALEACRDKTRNLKQAMMQELLIGKTRLVPAGTAHA